MLIKRGKAIRGQTLVEFALVLTTLLMIIFGIFDFGRTFQAWMTVQHSAQAAARYATTGQGYLDGDIKRLGYIKDEALR
ncbi:MAG: TadE family protein, partial [Anaerolineales bacterium]